jgi:hypothetical protein
MMILHPAQDARHAETMQSRGKVCFPDRRQVRATRRNQSFRLDSPEKWITTLIAIPTGRYGFKDIDCE